MPFEYTVIPAPTRGEKARDVKTPTDRYALAVTQELNRMAKDGWEYIRADVLPSDERSGLTGRTTIYHNLLVFRRKADATETPEPERQQIPQPEYPVAAAPVRKPQPAPALPEAAAPQPPRRVSETVPAATADAEPIVKENPTGAEPPAPRTEPDRI
ncbi:MAG: DUF4177 domain-containing protein [Paracoccus sp.]|nr:DUF4177 domain-containing protein [Paracoccus sp. (in: a-proteobacteria)]